MESIGWGEFLWDPEFVERFRLGDAAALREAYVLHVADASRVARRVLGPRCATDVDDVVQEVFAKAFTSSARSAFDGARPYGPYVRTLTRNISINWLLKHRREVSTADIDSLSGETTEDFGVSAANSQALQILTRNVARLSLELRRIYELRYREGMTQRAVCATLGLSRQELRTKERHLVAVLRRKIMRREGLLSA